MTNDTYPLDHNPHAARPTLDEVYKWLQSQPQATWRVTEHRADDQEESPASRITIEFDDHRDRSAFWFWRIKTHRNARKS